MHSRIDKFLSWFEVMELKKGRGSSHGKMIKRER